ncbi:hypothetical protein DSL72_007365 [Monilinia vaccinii-corymbosi]|uniref:Uncharacterized protein n=1 Tax=Monilinia vaccinii-corymbosi TaxID=61207 RepID=A0A8A3PMT3_9HELO|nr:hypothetical protein DSL72_007365 [Monilinia vaccinii-corymbosi]
MLPKNRDRNGVPREEIEAVRHDLYKLWQLAEAAAREIGVHLEEKDLLTIQGYIVASVQMIKALQLEIQQKHVTSDYVMFLQQRNREGARVINEMGNMPGVGVVPGNLAAAVGAVNVAPSIDLKSFKEQIWAIYLGLFNSERNLTIIITDRQMELPVWESAPVRIDSENNTYANNHNVPGSQPYWNGPYDDDHGRAIHVHEAFKAVEGRGLIAQTELRLVRQYIEPATDTAYKNELEERIDRRYPIYRALQASINNLTQTITIAFLPKKNCDLLILMLSRIEMDCLNIRLMQLIQTVNNYWHLIPRGDHDMARQMSSEISNAHGAQVACEAELTRPSDIAPAPPYPGKLLPSRPAYMPHGNQIIPPYGGNTNKIDQDDNKGKKKGSQGDASKDKKENNARVRSYINRLEKELERKNVKFDKIGRDPTNFANAPSDASADDKLVTKGAG